VELRDRTALVTGSALRIGREICLALAGRGANVVINYRTSAEAAGKLVDEIAARGGAAIALQGDVSRGDDVRRIRDHAAHRFGRIDALVNNASIYPKTPLATLTEEQWDESIAVNLKGPFLCCLEIGRHMIASGGGAIVNLADWAAYRPYADYLPYLTAKGGIITMTMAFARELAPTVRVNAIAPGPIAPPLDLSAAETEEARAGTLLGRWGSPRDIAAATLFLIEGSDFITGAILPVDGGRLVA